MMSKELSRRTVTEIRAPRAQKVTLPQIVAVARQQVRGRGGFSLRKVAEDLSLTAPALYRYVPDADTLSTLVAVDIKKSVAGRLAWAVLKDASSPVEHLLLAAVEFRNWAVLNEDEFAFAFLGPWSTAEEDAPIGALLSSLYDEAARAGERAAPLEDPRTLHSARVAALSTFVGLLMLELRGPHIVRADDFLDHYRAFVAVQADALGATGEVPRLMELLTTHAVCRTED